MNKATLTITLLACAAGVLAQGAPATPPTQGGATEASKQQALLDKIRRDEALAKQQAIQRGEQEGVEVRIKDIARFRGVRPNQLIGTGLVVGLAGTGDTKKSVITSEIVSNLFRQMGITVPASQIDMKNVAAVMITAELPPFATNGQTIDVTVEAIGDSKSLVGGTLLQTSLHAAGDRQTVYAAAQGAIAIGGFDVGAGGSSSSKGHVTAGRIPGGAIVERGAPTKLTYDGKMYLELDTADLTNAQRVATKLREEIPQLLATAQNGGTIELTLPDGMSPVEVMSRIEAVKVMSDTPATIVVNEKTGTIVIGGNVRVGPAAIAQGSLTVRIDSIFNVSQPRPLTDGATVVTQESVVTANEPNAQVATLAPNTTVQDLARVFQALQLKAKDIIAILQALRQQGALKARIITQ
jgi:flagellar P-ring protein FlgI